MGGRGLCELDRLWEGGVFVSGIACGREWSLWVGVLAAGRVVVAPVKDKKCLRKYTPENRAALLDSGSVQTEYFSFFAQAEDGHVRTTCGRGITMLNDTMRSRRDDYDEDMRRLRRQLRL